MDTTKGSSVFKAGKLLKITLEYTPQVIVKASIHGDFFMYPEEGIEKLEDSLKGTPLQREQIKAKVEEFMKGAQVFGFDAEQMAEAIMMAAGKQETAKK